MEVELPDNDEPVIETDLYAPVDRQVISAEAKTTNALGKNSPDRDEAARKRVLAAKRLMTDQIVLATTSWQERLVGPKSVVSHQAGPCAGQTFRSSPPP